ncbi:hypothetical protein LSAT2_013923 [Lamellibrachia satsuma]|nr:hypothetical protein LSAT2_013923 [Lamellibrachia satsuma]
MEQPCWKVVAICSKWEETLIFWLPNSAMTSRRGNARNISLRPYWHLRLGALRRGQNFGKSCVKSGCLPRLGGSLHGNILRCKNTAKRRQQDVTYRQIHAVSDRHCQQRKL